MLSHTKKPLFLRINWTAINWNLGPWELKNWNFLISRFAKLKRANGAINWNPWSQTRAVQQTNLKLPQLIASKTKFERPKIKFQHAKPFRVHQIWGILDIGCSNWNISSCASWICTNNTILLHRALHVQPQLASNRRAINWNRAVASGNPFG